MLAARVSRKFPSQEGLTRSRREEMTEDGPAEQSPKCAMAIPMLKGDDYLPPMGITEYVKFSNPNSSSRTALVTCCLVEITCTGS